MALQRCRGRKCHRLFERETIHLVAAKGLSKESREFSYALYPRSPKCLGLEEPICPICPSSLLRRPLGPEKWKK